MHDLALIIGLSAAAVVVGMGITTWRIRRLQYPPELRWPSERERRRRKSKSEGRDPKS